MCVVIICYPVCGAIKLKLTFQAILQFLKLLLVVKNCVRFESGPLIDIFYKERTKLKGVLMIIQMPLMLLRLHRIQNIEQIENTKSTEDENLRFKRIGRKCRLI